MSHIVIVGGGYAGRMVAGRLALNSPDTRITLVDPSPVFTERVRLHQEAAGQQTSALPYSALLPPQASHRRARALGLDPVTRQLHLDDGVLRYDQLVLALGSSALRLPGDRQACYAMADRAEARSFWAAAKALPAGGRVRIVGAGLTGIELACELAETRPELDVQLLGALTLAFSPRGRAHLLATFARLGVKHKPEAWVVSAQGGALSLRDGSSEPYDLCVEAIGVRGPEGLHSWGLPLDEQGRMKTGLDLRVLGLSEVWAVGDSAAPQGLPMRACCAAALPMGAFVAEQIHRVEQGKATREHSWSDRVFCISLGRHEALIQPLSARGEPYPWIITGWLGTLVKERLCHMAANIARWEPRLGLTLYTWFPAAPPLLEGQ